MCTLERLFNIREGIGKREDRLPKRFTDVRLLADNPKSIVPIKKMLPKYYKLRGWNSEGIPWPKTLKKLGLDQL